MNAQVQTDVYSFLNVLTHLGHTHATVVKECFSTKRASHAEVSYQKYDFTGSFKYHN